ncbi:hypothetical protein CXB51_022474 [Gossypium anomalum]|uniref:Reverse transcriptase n=1 Tax=Gossypium anomalum TaxID=47600 RepID=A0A8J5Z8D1_9ROSI|nr:hypothetical protein CXB51_022474 [Gossypium anomalum]
MRPEASSRVRFGLRLNGVVLRLKVNAQNDAPQVPVAGLITVRRAGHREWWPEIATRMNSWSKRLLSYGGKEVFIKAILHSIPTYAFSVFLAPKGIIMDLQSNICRTWWANNGKDCGWNMMAWDRLCYPKGIGGMGFRDMHLFNLALLGRQVWRLLKFRDTLCFKVLSAKYFLDGDVFQLKRCNRPSFTWSSVAKAATKLKDGFIWKIGNGSLIDIWWDQWGIEGLNGNSDRIIELYGTELGEHICNLPIPPYNFEDSRTWLHNPHGSYTSKSAYSWLSLKKIGYGPHRLYWRIIWKLKMLPKIKVFSWRIGHDILPTYANIARIRHNFSTTCPRCKNNEESLIHALKECPKVRETLTIGGFNNRFLDGSYSRCIDWLEDILRELDSKATADFSFSSGTGKDNPARMVWERAYTLSNDFRIFNLNNPPVIPWIPVYKGWKKPPTDFIKINVDAAVSNGNNGYGAIARDADGFVIAGSYAYDNKAIDAVWAELKAVTFGMKLASSLNLKKIIMKSDNATLINTFKNREKDVTILGCCVKQECRDFNKFDTIQFNWTDRRVIVLLTCLAKWLCAWSGGTVVVGVGGAGDWPGGNGTWRRLRGIR